MSDVRVLAGDCLEILPTLAGNSIDACVTDPPYGLSFMGENWDHGVPSVEFWLAIKRVLKPGAHLLSFGGTRTYHRMACAIEDAGFEMRDAILWHYGTGFPKSRNLDGEWKGWGTALKPATEIVAMTRKPLSEKTVEANVLKHGTGALNIGACRVASQGGRHREGEASQEVRYTTAGSTNFAALPGPRGGDPAGRWPANVIHDGSDEVMEAFPNAPGQQGDLKKTGRARPSRGIFGDMAEPTPHPARNDSGSAARFFYAAKASKRDRRGSAHPTVKPVALMAYLCRLVTPPGGTVLDPFAGTGATGEGAWLGGFDAILIEREAEYVADIENRIRAMKE